MKKIFIPLIALVLLLQANAFCESIGSMDKVNEKIHGTFGKLTVYADENCTDGTFKGVYIIDEFNFSFLTIAASKEAGFVAEFGGDKYKRESSQIGEQSMTINVSKKNDSGWSPFATVTWDYEREEGEKMYDGKFTVAVGDQKYEIDYTGEACPRGATFLALMLSGLTENL